MSYALYFQIGLLELVVNKFLSTDIELSDNMDFVDKLNSVQSSKLEAFLMKYNKYHSPLMTKSAREVFKTLNDYFDDVGDFTSKEKVINDVTKILNLNNKPLLSLKEAYIRFNCPSYKMGKKRWKEYLKENLILLNDAPRHRMALTSMAILSHNEKHLFVSQG